MKKYLTMAHLLNREVLEPRSSSDLKIEELSEIDVAMETDRISSLRLISLVCC